MRPPPKAKQMMMFLLIPGSLSIAKVTSAFSTVVVAGRRGEVEGCGSRRFDKRGMRNADAFRRSIAKATVASWKWRRNIMCCCSKIWFVSNAWLVKTGRKWMRNISKIFSDIIIQNLTPQLFHVASNQSPCSYWSLEAISLYCNSLGRYRSITASNLSSLHDLISPSLRLHDS